METAETILHTWMKRVWNQLDVGAMDELLASDAPVHGLGPDPLVGPAGFAQFHAAFTGGFDQIHIDVTQQVANGDWVAARWSGTMTHRATGKAVAAEGMAIAVVHDGKIRQSWNSADFLPLLIELGFVSADAMERALKPQ